MNMVFMEFLLIVLIFPQVNAWLSLSLAMVQTMLLRV